MNELTSKQKKKAYWRAIDSSLEHLVNELEARIKRGVEEDGDRIIPERLKVELKKAKSEFDNLDLSIQSHALSGEMAYRYIDQKIYDRIKEAEDGTYFNIFKWIDSDKTKPQLDKVFKGRVLVKYIGYLEGELSDKRANNQTEHLENNIDTAIEWAITNIDEKENAKRALEVYARGKKANPKRSANNIFEREIEDHYSVSKSTFYEWVKKYEDALKKLPHAQDI